MLKDKQLNRVLIGTQAAIENPDYITALITAIIFQYKGIETFLHISPKVVSFTDLQVSSELKSFFERHISEKMLKELEKNNAPIKSIIDNGEVEILQECLLDVAEKIGVKIYRDELECKDRFITIKKEKKVRQVEYNDLLALDMSGNQRKLISSYIRSKEIEESMPVQQTNYFCVKLKLPAEKQASVKELSVEKIQALVAFDTFYPIKSIETIRGETFVYCEVSATNFNSEDAEKIIKILLSLNDEEFKLLDPEWDFFSYVPTTSDIKVITYRQEMKGKWQECGGLIAIGGAKGSVDPHDIHKMNYGLDCMDVIFQAITFHGKTFNTTTSTNTTTTTSTNTQSDSVRFSPYYAVKNAASSSLRKTITVHRQAIIEIQKLFNDMGMYNHADSIESTIYKENLNDKIKQAIVNLNNLMNSHKKYLDEKNIDVKDCRDILTHLTEKSLTADEVANIASSLLSYLNAMEKTPESELTLQTVVNLFPKTEIKQLLLPHRLQMIESLSLEQCLTDLKYYMQKFSSTSKQIKHISILSGNNNYAISLQETLFAMGGHLRCIRTSAAGDARQGIKVDPIATQLWYELIAQTLPGCKNPRALFESIIDIRNMISHESTRLDVEEIWKFKNDLEHVNFSKIKLPGNPERRSVVLK